MVHASPLKTNSPNPRQCTQPPRPILPPAVSASFRQPGAAPPAQNAWATLKPAHALQFAHSLSHYSVRRTRTHFLDRPLSHIYYSILREFLRELKFTIPLWELMTLNSILGDGKYLFNAQGTRPPRFLVRSVRGRRRRRGGAYMGLTPLKV